MTALTGHGPLGWAFPLVARGRLFCRSVQLVSSRRERELQTFAHFTTHHLPPTTHYCILPSPHSKDIHRIVSHRITSDQRVPRLGTARSSTSLWLVTLQATPLTGTRRLVAHRSHPRRYVTVARIRGSSILCEYYCGSPALELPPL